MNTPKNKTLYICYHLFDKKAETAGRWAAYQAGEAGFTVGLGPWDELPGNDFIAKMKKASQCYEIILNFITGGSFEVMFPSAELKTRLILGKTGLEEFLIVARIDSSNISRLSDQFSYIDLNCLDEKEARARLLNGITAKLADSGMTPPSYSDVQQKYISGYTKLSKGFDSTGDLLASRRQDLKSILDHLLQNNYHMQLALEIETTKETAVADESGGRIGKVKAVLWEKIDLATILSDSHYYLLINSPGMGKTVFSYFTSWEMLRQNDLYNYFPLPLTWPAINCRKKNESLEDALSVAIESFYNNSQTLLINKDWSNLCLIIDALEQAPSMPEAVQSINLQNRRLHYRRAKIILTSREKTALMVPPDFKRIRLKLPEEKEIKYYLGGEYQKAETTINANRGAMTTPLILKMLRDLVINGRAGANKNYSRTLLYHEFIQMLINKEKKRPRFFNDPQSIQDFLNFEVEEYLERIAFLAIQNNEFPEIRKENLAAFGIDSLKIELLLRTEIVNVLCENQNSKLVFRDPSFYAYFAARFIYHQDRDIFRQLVSHISSFYMEVRLEVIRFYLGLERDPDQITVDVDLICSSYETENADLFKTLRLIHAAILTSETCYPPLNISDILDSLRNIISEAKECVYFLKLHVDQIFTAHEKYRKLLVNSVIKPFIQDEDWAIRMTLTEVLGRIGALSEIPILKPLLHDDDWSVRSTAAEVLEKIIFSGGSERAYSELQSLLRDKDRNVKAVAIKVLRKIGATNDLHLLMPLLRDKEQNLREMAIETVGIIGASSDISLLIPLLQDEDWHIRRAAAKAYGKIATIGDLHAFRALLKDKDTVVRRITLEALSKFLTEEDIPLLQSLLREKDNEIRRSAANALGRIITSDDILLVKPLLQDEDSVIRKKAVEMLGKTGASGEARLHTVALLKPLILDEDKEVRIAVLKTLGKIDTTNAPSPQYLLQDKNPLLLKASLEALMEVLKESPGEFNLPEITTFLFSLRQDKDRVIRRMAVEALENIITPKEIHFLKPLIQSEDPLIRREAVKILGKIGASNHINILKPLLHDEDLSVREIAVETLGEIGASHDTPLLKSFLQENEWNLQKTALEALGKIGSANDIPLLKPLLWDNDKSLRTAAIEVLGKIGSADDIHLLNSFLQDRHVRREAVVALETVFKRMEPVKINTNNLAGSLQPLLNLSSRQRSWNILHVSDFGYQPENADVFEALFDSLLKKLKNWRQKENAKIDMICITGDLAWSGEELQYQNLEHYLKRLLEISGCMPEYVFIAPGEHDLQDYLKDPPDNEALLEDIYEKKAEINRDILGQYANYQGFFAKLENYHRFLARSGYKNSLPRIINDEPKPWFATRIEDANLIIIGLYSPLFTCQKYPSQGNIKMGLEPFREACQYISPKKNEQILVLTHHSPDLLDENEMEDMENELFKKYAIHLFGHNAPHHCKNIELKTSDGQMMLRFGAGKIYNDNETEDCFNCFEILSLNYENLTVEASLFLWDTALKQWAPTTGNNPYRLPMDVNLRAPKEL